ncbi:hypothetical protein CERSUDRAFT_100673 [Gelatoporia subvermispora B]|uniref:Uncharacterized protein n=1 Tax=Ceriporiopsis subvermispora (strain B) TaxID=914234 RepID=M2QX61_CERS8|nr:hypothetical protein CERSUDRAFT_100673 [Gelatoporia subvermispora B]
MSIHSSSVSTRAEPLRVALEDIQSAAKNYAKGHRQYVSEENRDILRLVCKEFYEYYKTHREDLDRPLKRRFNNQPMSLPSGGMLRTSLQDPSGANALAIHMARSLQPLHALRVIRISHFLRPGPKHDDGIYLCTAAALAYCWHWHLISSLIEVQRRLTGVTTTQMLNLLMVSFIQRGRRPTRLNMLDLFREAGVSPNQTTHDLLDILAPIESVRAAPSGLNNLSGEPPDQVPEDKNTQQGMRVQAYLPIEMTDSALRLIQLLDHIAGHFVDDTTPPARNLLRFRDCLVGLAKSVAFVRRKYERTTAKGTLLELPTDWFEKLFHYPNPRTTKGMLKQTQGLSHMELVDKAFDVLQQIERLMLALATQDLESLLSSKPLRKLKALLVRIRESCTTQKGGSGLIYQTRVIAKSGLADFRPPAPHPVPEGRLERFQSNLRREQG